MMTGPTSTDAAHTGSALNGLGQRSAARAARSRTPGGLNGQRAAAAVAFLAGVSCCVGGVTVMAAWLVHSGAVLHWPIGGNPMAFNTALCLVVTGAALVAVSRRTWGWLAVVGAGLDVIMGTVVLAQYASGRSLGVDDLFVDPRIEGVVSSTPGRMAFNTAVCLVLAGVGLAALGRWWPWPRQAPTVAAATGSLIAAVAVLSLFGYAVGVSAAYSWLSETAMPLPTGALMLVVALGLVTLAWRVDPRGQWLAMPVAAVSLGAVFLVWVAITDRQVPTFGVQGHTAVVAVAAVAVLTAVLVAFAVWAALRAEHGRRLVAASESRLFQFLDALPVGVFITSEAGLPYFANTEAVRLLGRGLRPDVGGESLPEVYHAYVGGTDRLYPAQDTPLVRAGRGESAVVDDMDIHQPGGVVLPVEVRGKPIFAADGTIEFAVAAFIDISDRRAADQAVADQASLLDLAHDAIIVSDTQRRITYWNHGAERTYGFTRAQALGRVASEMLETQYPIAMADIDADIDASGSWQGELIQRRRDGHWIVVASRWAARRADGTRVATMEINRDITDAKEASAYTRRLIEASPDSLVMIGLDGTITDVNQAAERVTATPREQLVGAGFGSFFTEPERALEGYQRALTDGVLTDFPLVVRRPDGALIDEMVTASLYRSATDDVVGVFVTARDVTDHNRAQRELTRRAADLEQSNTALTRSNAELEQFAYIASHDLSEPLRSIAGFADLLRLRYHGSLDTDADAYLDFITAGTTRMQHLIDDLLAYSRLTTRAHPLTPVDLRQVMDTALADLDARIGDTGAKVRIDTTLPVVTGDATQLTQVFANLIRNAITYITPGTTPDVHVSADRDGPFWRFTVADNGIGIPPEHRERVFGMFKRLHSRDTYPGTGVGLAIVQKVVHRHQGTTTIADNPGGGTRITFTIRDTTPDITSDPPAGADCDAPDRWVLR